VTATPGGVQTNRPVPGASVEIYRVSADAGERIGGAIHASQSAADVGRPVVALFNQERVVARAWPASENRIAVAELTY
jgi:hypothetical protein